MLCVAENFFPNTLSVKWKEDGRDVIGMDWPSKEYTTRSNDYKAISLLRVTQNVSKKDTEYTCDVTHLNKIYTVKKVFGAQFVVKTNPPIQKELFINNKAIIQCVISGNNKMEVETANVSWTVGGKEVEKKNITDGVVEPKEDLHIKTSTLTLDGSVWFSREAVKCFTMRQNKIVFDEISFKQGAPPSILIHKSEKPETQDVSLVCEVNSPNLGDVYVMWLKDKKPFSEASITAPILKSDKSMSVFSPLSIPRAEYNKGETFACAVKHAYMEKGTAPPMKTTSKSKVICPNLDVKDRR